MNMAEQKCLLPQGGIRPFMAHLIDYAGLFPPASLPLDPAIRNYAWYQKSKEAWMLGRFILPISRLSELESYMSLFTPHLPLRLSGLGSKSADKWECLERLGYDLEALLTYRKRYGRSVTIDVLELPLPPISIDPGLLNIIGIKTEKMGLQTFCEMTLPLNESWEQNLNNTLDLLAEHNRKSSVVLGFKLRTGGVTADAFPTPAQVAAALVGCRDREIPMKFTAGLHHPIRMYRNEVKARMHGFANVFAAGMLAHIHQLSIEEIEPILSDEDPAHFSFTFEGLAWRDQSISLSEIEKLRTTSLCSYGSCSFDEPREDLESLKML